MPTRPLPRMPSLLRRLLPYLIDEVLQQQSRVRGGRHTPRSPAGKRVLRDFRAATDLYLREAMLSQELEVFDGSAHGAHYAVLRRQTMHSCDMHSGIVQEMTGRDLLQALMERENTNPTKLARELKAGKGLQSAISRYLARDVLQPRLETIKPVLDRYGIDLVDLIDDRQAARTAARLGLLGKQVPQAAEPAPSYLADWRKQSALPQLIIELGAELRKLDEPTLAKVRTHLQSLAAAPDDADLIAALIGRTLGKPAP